MESEDHRIVFNFYDKILKGVLAIKISHRRKADKKKIKILKIESEILK